jgi:hypothetical protein
MLTSLLPSLPELSCSRRSVGFGNSQTQEILVSEIDSREQIGALESDAEIPPHTTSSLGLGQTTDTTPLLLPLQ